MFIDNRKVYARKLACQFTMLFSVFGLGVFLIRQLLKTLVSVIGIFR